jgi:hypothetical protein
MEQQGEVKQRFLSYLESIKDETLGFMEISNIPEKHVFDVYLDASFEMFTSRGLFDAATDEQATFFLNSFLDQNFHCGWGLSEQLSKLLSVRGHLVAQRMTDLFDSLLQKQSWVGTYQLFLSYLVLHPDGAKLAIQLLDQVDEDCRDGLFLACYRIDSEELDRKLIKKFQEWDADSYSWGPGSTGELYALEQFVAKWLDRYSIAELEHPIRIYFKHRRES